MDGVQLPLGLGKDIVDAPTVCRYCGSRLETIIMRVYPSYRLCPECDARWVPGKTSSTDAWVTPSLTAWLRSEQKHGRL